MEDTKKLNTMTDNALLEYWCELWEMGGLTEWNKVGTWLEYSNEYKRVMKEVEYRGGLETLARKIK